MTRDDSLVTSKKALILALLSGGLDPRREPHLLEDDLLHLALGIVARHDMAWVTQQLLDPAYDYALRCLVAGEAPSPLREEILDRLRAETGEAQADPGTRDRAAAELGDLLEGEGLDPEAWRQTVDRLLDAAATETDPVVRETLYNSLAQATANATTDRIDSFDWSRLAGLVGLLRDPGCLEHALFALGAVRRRVWRPIIRRYLVHESPRVRSAAREALAEIDED